MRLRLRERRPQPELLDQEDLPLDEIEKSLADIRWVNRFWGGRRAAESLVRAIVSLRAPQSVLDFGSGSGDLPAYLKARAGRRGIPLTVISLDRQVAHLSTARRLFGAPRLVAADALCTPLADASVDWVFSSHFFHHFSPEENVRILREMARVARRGIFVLDLRRNGLSRAIAALLGPFVFRSRLSVADARISIEQAYTPSEAAAIARRAELDGAGVRPVFPFRFVLRREMSTATALSGIPEPEDRFDVAIVGAGPAGTCAAIALRRAGFSVVVLERDRFPRHKVCGEFLSPEAIDDLEACGAADRIRSAGGEAIERGAFFFEGRRSIEFPLPRPAVGISRYRLDAILAETASAAGARVRDGRKVEGVSGDLERGFRLSVEGEERPVAARAVLAAWGRWSPLDLAMGRAFASRTHGRFFGWSRHDAGNSAHLAGRVHLYFFRGGYCGLSRVEGGIVNFAGVVSERELRRRGAGWEKFLAALLEEQTALRNDLAPLSPERAVLGTPTVFFERHAPTFGGILAIGDAAGIRDPFTGDGQASAIRSGVLAARILAPFLARSVGAAALESSYRDAYAREFGARFNWDALFRRALFSRPVRRLLLPVALPVIRAGIVRTRLGTPTRPRERIASSEP